MSNPFKVIDEMITRKFRVPLPVPSSFADDWQPSTSRNGTVEFWEVLETLRALWSRDQAEIKHLRSERGRIYEVGSHTITGDGFGMYGHTYVDIYGRFHSKQDALEFQKIKQDQLPGTRVWVSEIKVLECLPKPEGVE